jgi:hypothetical protein
MLALDNIDSVLDGKPAPSLVTNGVDTQQTVRGPDLLVCRQSEKGAMANLPLTL